MAIIKKYTKNKWWGCEEKVSKKLKNRTNDSAIPFLGV